MKRVTLTLLIIFGAGLALSCGEKKPSHFGTDPKIIEAELKRRRIEINKKIKDSYDIPHMRSSRDKVIKEFLYLVARGKTKQAEKLVLTREEYQEIFWPNQPEKFTMNYGLSPNNAGKMFERKKNMGMRRLASNLGGSKISGINIVWKKDIRPLNALKGHLPRIIWLYVNGEKRSIKYIRYVIEHKGRYKIAVLTTG